MNVIAIQQRLDRPNGPLFKNNAYYWPLRRREPTAKYKSHGRHGRNYELKRPRS